MASRLLPVAEKEMPGAVAGRRHPPDTTSPTRVGSSRPVVRVRFGVVSPDRVATAFSIALVTDGDSYRMKQARGRGGTNIRTS